MAPDGTYLIVASFGSAARVLADRFIFSEQDRELLADVVDSVSFRESHTDVADLEDLIAGIRAGLAKRFARQGFRLQVEILTDGRPDPGAKSGQRVPPQTFDRLLGQSPSKTSLGNGLFVLGLVLDQPPPLAAIGEPDRAPDPAVTPVPTIGGLTPVPSPNTAVRSFASWSYGALALGLVLTGLLVWFGLRQPPVVEPGADHAGDPAIAALPAVLVVTEMQVADGTSKVIRERERVQVAPGVPVIVGSNPELCTLVVAPVEGAESGELFRVTPSRNGLNLNTVPGALCDGVPVPRRGLTSAGDRPLRVQLADREWVIALSTEDGNEAAVNDLFARLTRETPAEGQGRDPQEAAGA